MLSVAPRAAREAYTVRGCQTHISFEFHILKMHLAYILGMHIKTILLYGVF